MLNRHIFTGAFAILFSLTTVVKADENISNQSEIRQEKPIRFSAENILQNPHNDFTKYVIEQRLKDEKEEIQSKVCASSPYGTSSLNGKVLLVTEAPDNLPESILKEASELTQQIHNHTKNNQGILIPVDDYTQCWRLSEGKGNKIMCQTIVPYLIFKTVVEKLVPEEEIKDLVWNRNKNK